MEEIDFDFESLIDLEFPSENVTNEFDVPSYEDLLLVKKRIILTDELLGKFSETLTENEKLKAEKNKYFEELQQCRSSLLSHLSNKTDWQKRCNELETRLLATQQDLDLKTNLVAARDSVVCQYVNLVKEKDENIKKLQGDIETLKSNKNSEKSEEKKLKKKYNVVLNRCDKLRGIIEKLETCSSCQTSKRCIKFGKKVNKESDLEDKAILSPGSSIPASICSVDTGFESSLSDSETDLENVSQKKTPIKLSLEKIYSGISENDDQYRTEERVNEKCIRPSSRYELINDKVELSITVTEGQVIGENTRPDISATLCSNCLNSKKDTAEKYVQTRIVKFVDKCVDVQYDVQSASTQTPPQETILGEKKMHTAVLSKCALNVPTDEVGLNSPVSTKSVDLPEIISFCDKPVLQCNVGCQTNELVSEIRKSDAECQTEGKELIVCGDTVPNFENNSTAFHSNEFFFSTSSDVFLQKESGNKNSEEFTDIFGCPSYNIELYSPVPCLLSPMPPSPLMGDTESMKEADEIMSEMGTSSVSDEESVSLAEELNDSYKVAQCRTSSFMNSTTQTDRVHCICHQAKQNYLLDKGVQCESAEVGNVSTLEPSKSGKQYFNKYANKCKKEIDHQERNHITQVKKTEDDREEFWKKLILWFISNDRSNIMHKASIMNFLYDKSVQEIISEDHLFCGQLGTTKSLTGNLWSNSHCSKWKKLEDVPGDIDSIKPIVVEMNGNIEGMSSANQNYFYRSINHEDSGEKPKKSYDLSLSKELRNRVKLKREVDCSKMKNSKKIVKSASPKSISKGNRVKTRFSLKRKLLSEEHSEVPCTSGSFIVASIPGFIKESDDLDLTNKNNFITSCTTDGQILHKRDINFPNESAQCNINIQDNIINLNCLMPKGIQSIVVDDINSYPSSRALINMKDNEVNCNVTPDNSNILHPLNLQIGRGTVASSRHFIDNSHETIFEPVSTVGNNHSVRPTQSSTPDGSNHSVRPIQSSTPINNPDSLPEGQFLPAISSCVASINNHASCLRVDLDPPILRDHVAIVSQKEEQSLSADFAKSSGPKCVNSNTMTPFALSKPNGEHTLFPSKTLRNESPKDNSGFNTSVTLLSNVSVAEDAAIPAKIRKCNPPYDNSFTDSHILNSANRENQLFISRENSFSDARKHDPNQQENHLSISIQNRSCDIMPLLGPSKYTSNTSSFTECSNSNVQEIRKSSINKSSNLDAIAVSTKIQIQSQKEFSGVCKNVPCTEFESVLDLSYESSISETGTIVIPPVPDTILNSNHVSVVDLLNDNDGGCCINKDNINLPINSEMGGCVSDASFSKLERNNINNVSKGEFKEIMPGGEESGSVVQGTCINNPSSISLVKEIKECSKTVNNSKEVSCSQEKTATPRRQTSTYRKRLESTVSELIPVKPPPVEKEIAQKTAILEKVKANGLLAVKKTECAPKCRSVSLPKKSREIQNQSTLSESVFCRQGMTGRRKTSVKTSKPSVSCPGPSICAESNTNNFSAITKQQRIAHVSKSSTTCTELNFDESFCNEPLSIHKKPEKQLEVRQNAYLTMPSPRRSAKSNVNKSVYDMPSSAQDRTENQPNVRETEFQRPTLKRSKLQKLKQQCVKQRKLIQTLIVDSTALEPINQRIVNKSDQEELVNTVSCNDVEYSVTLQDIALDMALSDSEESVCEESSRRNSYPEKDELNLEDKNWKVAFQLPSELETNDTSNQKHPKHEECFDVLSSCDNLAENSEVLQSKQKFPQTNSVENLNKNCHNSVPISYQMSESVVTQDMTNEKMSESDAFIKSYPTNSQNDLVVNSISSHSSNAIHTDSVINRKVNCLLLDSPLSPPDSSNCDTNSFHLPPTIPTNPVHAITFECLDKEVDIRNLGSSHGHESDSDVRKQSDSDVTKLQDSDSTGEEVNNSETEESELDKSIFSGTTENSIKTKLRSWGKELSSSQKKCQSDSLLQYYFEHHFKNQNLKKKKGKALKNYKGKGKKIDLLFDGYMEGEFTESALADVLAGCKTITQGDCRIIVKYAVKYCRYSSEEVIDLSNSFPLNSSQQRLFTLIVKLESDHPTIIDEVLKQIEFVVCNIKHRRFKQTLYCLARFFTAFCKFRNMKHRAQMFCYDALYCLKSKAHIVVYAVLTAFPECFPNADSAASGSLVVQAIVNVIHMFGDANAYVHTKNLRSYISDYYNYKRDNLPTAENLLKQYIEEIKRGMIQEVEQAMLLLVKFKSDWAWTHKKVIKDCLLQTVESWKNGDASEAAAAWCLRLSAYLAKTPPYEMIDISPLMTEFEKLLFSDSSPAVVKEACIFSIATLAQMDDRKVFLILKYCKCEEYLQNSALLRDVLNNVLKRRKANWWTRFFRTRK